LNLFIFSCLFAQGEEQMAVPGPKGILVFTGMELANGKKITSYSVERSTDKKNWEKVADLTSPQGWEAFYTNINKWKEDFGFQGLPKTEDLKERWKKCETAGVIDSMGYWTPLTSVRLAAGIAWYDQTAAKDTRMWYKIRVYGQDGKIVSEHHSLPVQWPYIPEFDEVSLTEKNVDKTFFYLKWQSKGSLPASYFSVRYYENGELKTAKGSLATYQSGDKKYYIFQDSTRYLKSERQYFMNPVDVYGNQAAASDMVLVSNASVTKSFFTNTQAVADPKGLGIILNWRMKNAPLTENIRIYKSDSFDGKPYEVLASIPATDTSYIDRNVIPDKIYYYYLVGENKQHDESFQTNVFFNAAYDKLKPVPPVIRQGKSTSKGVEIQVTANDKHVSGLKIYRSDGYTSKLYPVSALLKPANDLVVFMDTSKVLTGEKSYLYAATTVNTSSVESDFSDTLTIHPDRKTSPPSPNRISAYEEDNQVKIIWEDVRTRHRATHGYHIYRRELPDGKFAPLLPKDSIVLAPMFTDKTAQTDKTYEYAVQTVDDLDGTSESMALYSIHVKKAGLPVPPNVWLTQNAGKVTVQWSEIPTTQPLKVNLYRYQRDSKPELLKSFSLDEQQFVDTDVKENGLYFYYTTFTDVHKNESPASKEKSIRLVSFIRSN
jgi:fibronectin type 3 domain-containing protein